MTARSSQFSASRARANRPFLRVLAGLTPASDGAVLYRGQRVTEPANGIAMVFQTFALFPWLTVLGNVELGLEAQGVSGLSGGAAR